MADPVFESFGDIKPYSNMQMAVTQKLHGSNAQIYVYDREDGTPDVRAGSRGRWVYPHDDNYGFASWVASRKEDIIKMLGYGRHFGEWVGKGINNGEGRDTKTLALFSWWRWKDKPLPEGIELVPLLYQGPVDMTKVDEVMEDLKTNGLGQEPWQQRNQYQTQSRFWLPDAAYPT